MYSRIWLHKYFFTLTQLMTKAFNVSILSYIHTKSCRFLELSWFWDHNSEWLLPAKCPECSKVITADTVEKEILQSSSCCRCQIPCPECHHVFQHIPKYARGDPHNIARIGHWDGWQPFGSTGQHSCGESTCHMYMHCMITNEVIVLSGKSLLPQ